MFYIAKDALLESKRYSIQTLIVILFYKHKPYPDGKGAKSKYSKDK